MGTPTGRIRWMLMLLLAAGLAPPLQAQSVQHETVRPAAGPQQAPSVLGHGCATPGAGLAKSPNEAPSTELKIPDQQPSDCSRDRIRSDPKTEVSRAGFAQAVCLALGREAMANDLPAEFFTRLIWQESRFDPRARSHKGAEGIAQFMPGTARWRGLSDAYEPFQALHESARWLAELRAQFGNLGLAAAAYNAGPGRIQNWLAGRGGLPHETRHYVRVVTGHTVEDWSQQRVKTDEARIIKIIPCNDIAKLLWRAERRASAAVLGAGPVSGLWGLQLAGDWSESRALAEFRTLQERFPAILGDKQPVVLRGQLAGKGSAIWYRVRVAESSRERAQLLCGRLRAAGGNCLVFKN